MKTTDKLIEDLSTRLQELSTANDPAVDQLLQVMDQASKNQKIDKQALENGAIYIVGTTGAGKSTLLNYLVGKELNVIKEKGVVKLELANPDDGVSAIGSGKGKSETIYPITYTDTKNNGVRSRNPRR